MNQTSAYKLQNEVLLHGIKNEFGAETLNTVLFDDPTKIISLISYYEKKRANANVQEALVFNFEINRLETLLNHIIDINCDILGINANTMSTIKEPHSTEKDTSKVEKPDAKVVGLVHGEVLSEMPTLKDLKNACTVLLKKNKKEEAIDLANIYLPEGKYTPNEGRKAHSWSDKNIQNWLKEIDERIVEETVSKKTSKEESKKEVEENVSKTKTPIVSSDKDKETVQNKTQQQINKEQALKILGDINPNNDIEVVDLQSYEDNLTLLRAIKTYDLRVFEKLPKLTEEQNLQFDTLNIIKGGDMFPDSVDSAARRLALQRFGSPHGTLYSEKTAFKFYANIIHELHNPSDKKVDDKTKAENIKKADLIVNAFFKYRGYSKEQISSWREKVINAKSKNDDSLAMDLLMGIPAVFGIKELTPSDKSYESIYKEMHPLCLSGVSQYEIINLHTSDLLGKSIKGKDGLSVHLYTPLHVHDFVSKTYHEVSQSISSLREEYLISSITEFIKEHKTLSVIKEQAAIKSMFNNRYYIANEPLVKLDEKYSIKVISKGLPKEGPLVYFTSSEGLDKYITDLYNVIMENMSSDIKGDYKNQITIATFEEFLKKNAEKGINDLMMSDFIKKVADKGYLISDSKNFKLCWVVEKFKDTKDLRNYIEGFLEKNTKIETKPADSTLFNAFTEKQLIPEKVTDLYPMGKELITRFDYDMDKIKKWGKAYILNVKLKGSDPSSMFKDEEKLNNLLTSMFRNSFQGSSEKSSTKLEKMELTPEVERILMEKTGLVPMVKQIRSYFTTNGLRVGLKDAYEFTKNLLKDLNPAILAQQKADKEASKIKPVVEQSKEVEEEAIVEAEIFDGPIDLIKDLPDVWAKVKTFTKLDEVYNFIRELNESGDWKTALSTAITLITKNDQITDAKGWTEDQVTTWFNTTFSGKQLGPEIEEPAKESEEETIADSVVENVKVEEPETVTKELTDKESQIEETKKIDFTPVTSSLNKTSYVDGIRSIFTKHGTSSEIRTQLVDAIKTNSVGKYAKRIAKNKVEDIYNGINKQATLVASIK